jgi:hypothetical protein
MDFALTGWAWWALFSGGVVIIFCPYCLLLRLPGKSAVFSVS